MAVHKNQKKFFKILAGIFLLIIVVSGFLLTVSENDTLFYYTVNEVADNPNKYYNKKLRMMGLVEMDSAKSLGNNVTEFNITEDNIRNVKVRFKGIKPDMFKEGQGVVAEGFLGDDNIFTSELLLVKHTEEYKTPEDAGNMQTLVKSINQNATQ